MTNPENFRDRCEVQIRNLSAAHRQTHGLRRSTQRTIVEDFNFDLQPGKIYGLTGENGRGKTTLLSAIIDASHRLRGSVRVSGGGELNETEVGYMPQAAAPTTCPWNRVVDEVALSRRVHAGRWPDWEREIEAFVAQSGLNLDPKQMVGRLSGGQKVKTAFLRALAVSNLRLLILDEPYEGVDHNSRRLLTKSLRKLAAEGVIILITSHRLDDLITLDAELLALDGNPVRGVKQLSAHAIPVRDDDSEDSRADQPNNGARPADLQKANVFPALLGIIVGLLIWQSAAHLVQNVGLLPGPISVITRSFSAFSSGAAWADFSSTMLRIITAWTIAAALSVPLGIILGYRHGLYRAIAPWLSVSRSLPVFALVAPAAGLLPGLPEAQRILLIVTTLALTAIQGISAAVAAAPRRRVETARIFGASHWFVMRNILFFESLGSIFSALEVTLPLAVVLGYVLETFLIPKTGMGSYLFNHLNDPDLSLFFGYMIIPGVVVSIGLIALRKVASRLRFD